MTFSPLQRVTATAPQSVAGRSGVVLSVLSETCVRVGFDPEAHWADQSQDVWRVDPAGLVPVSSADKSLPVS